MISGAPASLRLASAISAAAPAAIADDHHQAAVHPIGEDAGGIDAERRAGDDRRGEQRHRRRRHADAEGVDRPEREAGAVGRAGRERAESRNRRQADEPARGAAAPTSAAAADRRWSSSSARSPAPAARRRR